jgi:hypothetical protein
VAKATGRSNIKQQITSSGALNPISIILFYQRISIPKKKQKAKKERTKRTQKQQQKYSQKIHL